MVQELWKTLLDGSTEVKTIPYQQALSAIKKHVSTLLQQDQKQLFVKAKHLWETSISQAVSPKQRFVAFCSKVNKVMMNSSSSAAAKAMPIRERFQVLLFLATKHNNDNSYYPCSFLFRFCRTNVFA